MEKAKCDQYLIEAEERAKMCNIHRLLTEGLHLQHLIKYLM